MNIRNWFGYDGATGSAEVDHRFDELLSLYAKGVCRLFNSEPTDFGNVHDFYSKVIENPNISTSDQKFLLWLNEKALPYLKTLCGEPLPNCTDLIADLEFEAYNIEDELSYAPSQDLKICLINVVSYLPDRIESASDKVKHVLENDEVRNAAQNDEYRYESKINELKCVAESNEVRYVTKSYEVKHVTQYDQNSHQYEWGSNFHLEGNLDYNVELKGASIKAGSLIILCVRR